MLPRAQRLLKFQEVYRDGRAARGRYLSLRYIRRPGGNTRIGFAVARSVRSKARKNRLKRQLRSICRGRLDEFRSGLDIVVNIFNAASEASYEELERDLVRVTRQAGLARETLQEQT